MPDDTQQAQQVDFANDSDFHALPLGEKHKVMLSLDDDYKSLPGSEQVKALNAIHYGAQEKPKNQGFMSGFGAEAKDVYNQFKEHPVESLVGVAKPFVAPVLAGAEAGVEGARRAVHAYDPANETTAPLSKASRFGYAAASALSPLVPGLNPERMEKRAATGDTAGVAGEAAFPLAVTGVTELASRAPKISAKINEMREPSRIASGQEKFTEALDTAPGKRGEKAAQMKDDVHVATKDLAAIEKDAPSKTTWLLRRGKGADSFHELAEKIDARQDDMWEKGHSPGIERHAEAPIDENRIAEAGQTALTKMAERANPSEAETAAKWLSEQKQPTTLKEADELIRYINDDLKAKGAETRYGPLSVSVRQAVVRALRNEVERVLDASGEKGVKEVNRRWGALDNIKNRLRERAVQEARKEAKAGPLPDWAHAYAFLYPDMGVTLGAGVAAAKMLAPNMSSKLTSAMRSFGKTSLEAPYEATPPERWGAPPVGLLQAPKASAIEAPYRAGADVSGALSRDEQQGRWTTPRGLLERYPEQRANRLLPAPAHGEVAINATPDASEVLPAEPITNVQRTKSGRMQRVYEGTAKPRIVGQTADGGPIYERTPAVERSEQAISHEPIDKIRATRGAKERGVKGGAPPSVERRSSVRDIQGPDLMRTARANQLRALLEDPSLPDADRAIIEAQLADLRAHPFEKHEGGDINSMKKERRLSREEAEKNSEERKKGRSARFEDIKLKPRNESKIAIEGVDAAHSQEHDRIKIDPFTERYQKNLRKRKLQRA